MKSPIKVKTWQLLGKGRTYYGWACDDARLKIAKLQSRKQPNRTVLIHPSIVEEKRLLASNLFHG